MSETREWQDKAVAARASARRIRQLTDTDIVTRYVPRLAGRNIHLTGEPALYDTREEAVEAARRVRRHIVEVPHA